MSKWISSARGARLAVAAAMTAVVFAGAPAQAVTINYVYDSSITSLANASTVESDLNSVAQYFDKTFATPVTVNIGVSWGSVGGQAIPSGDVSSSLDNLYGGFSYSQIKTDLTTTANGNPADTALVTAAAHLPASVPAGVSQFAVPSAEAKALGLIPGFLPGTDGYIGFNKSTAWDFNPANGVTANTYDFVEAAAHETEEVLGRISGLTSASPSFRTPFDLFRYGASGQMSFGYTSSAYFSVNGGATNFGAFNISGGGDRGDWAAGADAQSAYLKPGQGGGFSVADLTALDALGWGGSNVGDSQMMSPTLIAQSFMGASVPEPANWMLLIAGVGLLGAALRRRASSAVACR